MQFHSMNADCEEKFICTKNNCRKSFYNKTALLKHKVFHHDLCTPSSEEESANSMNTNKNSFDYAAFKFIPRKIESNDTEDSAILSNTFQEDTSYIILKIESSDEYKKAIKRKRLEGVMRKNLSQPEKLTIDFRGPFTCTNLQCGLIFFNCCEYSLHYRDEHTKRRKAALRCQICEKRLDRDFAKDTFMTANYSFSCRSCSQTFYSSVEYDNHNRIAHAKLKPYKCSLCPKRFTQPGGLHQHMRMHAGIRPFSCTYCLKAFTQKAGLEQHLRTHTKVKPFICIVCRKRFSQSVHLRQHMRTHTNIQPFECPVCQRRFKQSSHLNFHMRTHPEELKYMSMKSMQSQDDYNELLSHQKSQIIHTQLVDDCKGAQQNCEGTLQRDFVKLNDLLPIQEGGALYYTARISPGLQMHSDDYVDPQLLLAEKVLTL